MFLINTSEKIYKSKQLIDIKFDTYLKIVLNFSNITNNLIELSLGKLLEFNYQKITYIFIFLIIIILIMKNL